MTEPSDHYKTLQVDDEAEFEVIQAAYRRLARKYHPDAGGGPEAAARMIVINAAWEVLQDPARRAAYDAERRRGRFGPRDAWGGSSTQAASSPDPTPPTPPPAWPERDLNRPAGPRAETTSPHWTAGRSTSGRGYDPSTMGAAQGEGAAGAPPGNPSGSVLNFGRYSGWSLGEIGRRDIEYLEWLDRAPIGRQYQAELDQLLRAAGRRRSNAQDEERRGLFRRR
ncbi:MAG: DnaJ domain-containing protein [Candidatus Limnocylindrales bacterium]